MFRYETHLHTFPVSKCAKASVEDSLTFYKKLGYDGVFITNHFIDGSINVDSSLPFEEKIGFYCSDYEKGIEVGKKIGLKVFFGLELSYNGTDFLVYGPDMNWILDNPRIERIKKTEELSLLMDSGALVIQAHPFREASYIEHIRLFPRHVHGVEVINACSSDFENAMAQHYAESYGLLKFAGSDNHLGSRKHHLAGMESDSPILDERDFAYRVKNERMSIFTLALPDNEPVRQ